MHEREIDACSGNLPSRTQMNSIQGGLRAPANIQHTAWTAVTDRAIEASRDPDVLDRQNEAWLRVALVIP
jgi:hypothetical protein